MIRILYIHGYQGSFNPSSERLAQFSDTTKFEVYGINHDSNITLYDVVDDAQLCCTKNNIDIIIGISLGGFIASHISSIVKLPCILINPVSSIVPMSKQRYLMNDEVISSYSVPFTPKYVESVYVGLNDTVIDPTYIIDICSEQGITCYEDEDADHRHVGVDLVDDVVSIVDDYSLLSSISKYRHQ